MGQLGHVTLIGCAIGESHLMTLAEMGYELKGVVHVGVNEGQEIRWYLDNGMRPVLGFEPHPGALQAARERFNYPDVTFVQMALGNHDGSLTLLVPQDGDTQRISRFHPIPTVGHDWTKIPMTESITVPVRRFDNWAVENKVDLTPFNSLSIDVQGMELDVLEGFGPHLWYFPHISVEVSQEPIYDGAPRGQEIVEFLEVRGYEQVTDMEVHQDVVFVRKDAPRRLIRRH